MKRITTILIIITTLAACKKTEFIETDVDVKLTKDYVFLGHTYLSNDVIDPRVAALDYTKYDQIWLGGDICSETTENQATLDMLDEQFDLSSETTHWTLGNHDIRNGNVQWITDKTKRPTYYTTNFNGITLMVLNSMFFYGGYDTLNVNQQFEMIQNVCDTIQQSSHLILMTHHMVWNVVVPGSRYLANLDRSDTYFNLNPTQYYHQCVYPLLEQVETRGVDVIHICGDFGQKSAKQEAITASGVQYLGSGITSNSNYHSTFPTHGIPDSILIFHHNIIERDLTWEFVQLD